jgi:copper resistance protein D
VRHSVVGEAMFIPQLILARAVHIGASILITGTFTFDLVMLGVTGPSESDDLREIERSLLRLTVWSLIVALLSALLWFWLEVASISGLPLANPFSSSAWGTVLLETRFGRAWQLRLGLIAAAFALVASAMAQVKARRALIAVLWLVSVVLLVSLAWISHAAAAGTAPIGLLSDMLHLCAAGLWVGGLLPLVIFLARVRPSFSLGETVARVVRRFSTLSLCCVSIIVVSGISNSWLLVGSIHALFTTPYGQLLLFKLALFAILLGFGARNRSLVKAKLPKASANLDLLAQLRRDVLCEVFLGIAVVVIVGCLGVIPPARHP